MTENRVKRPSLSESATRPAGDAGRFGLCASCRHARVIASNRGQRFLRCSLSDVRPDYPRYPALPVRICEGYEKG